MNIEKVSDLELAKLMAEQKDLAIQTNQNLMVLTQELSKRLNAVKGKDEPKE